MENNIIKKNQLELLPKNEIATIVEFNTLPMAKDKKELLPAIIRKDALALIEIKKEFYNVRKQRSIYGLAWFIKKVVVLLTAKLIRFMFLSTSRLASFAVFSVIVILSTTIITKNVVNSMNGITINHAEEQAGFSIYTVKDDEEAKARAEYENHETEVNQNTEVIYDTEDTNQE